MDLASFQDPIRELIESLIALHTQWEDQPRDFTPPADGAICLLAILAVVPIGRDESRQSQDLLNEGEEISTTYVGNRLLSLTVKVESHDQTTGKQALAWIERLRTKMFWASTRAVLNTNGMAFVEAQRPIDLTDLRDDRRVSVAALDIMLAARFEETDPIKGTWIETVEVKGPDGKTIKIGPV